MFYKVTKPKTKVSNSGIITIQPGRCQDRANDMAGKVEQNNTTKVD